MKPNEITLFLLSLIFIFPILVFDSLRLDIALFFWAIINLAAFKRLKLKPVFYFIVTISLPLVSVFFTTILYAKVGGDDRAILFLKIKTTKSALNLALFLTIRTFALSFISFAFLIALKYDRFINSLMQIFKLPVSIGYSLLATFNAFYHLKNEFVRIRDVYRMRFGKRKNPLLLFFPIMVSAARYAYYAGLSLQSRGLNPQKTFYKKESMKKIDFVILFVNLLITIFFIYNFVYKNNLGVKLM